MRNILGLLSGFCEPVFLLILFYASYLLMPYDLKAIDLPQLRHASRSLTTLQLETARDWVQELIDARRQRIVDAVGERHQKELRAQMAKAGISWEEFQNTLK